MVNVSAAATFADALLAAILLGCVGGWLVSFMHDGSRALPSPTLSREAELPDILLVTGTVVATILVVRCCGRKPQADATSSEYDRASLISVVMFSWMWPAVKKAYDGGKLELDDLPKLPAQDNLDRLNKRFAKYAWRRGETILLFWRICVNVQWRVLARSLLCLFLFRILILLDPLVLHVLLASRPDRTTHNATLSAIVAAETTRSPGDDEHAHSPSAATLSSLLLGLGCVAGLSLSMLLRVTLMESGWFANVRHGANCRAVLSCAIFRTALRIPAPEAEAKGRLLNLMATDANKFSFMWLPWFWGHWIWSILSLPIVVGGLYWLLGSAAFLGLAITIFTNAAAYANGRLQRRVTRRLQERRDARSALLTDVLREMQHVRLVGGGDAWYRTIAAARDAELRELRRQMFLAAANSAVSGVLSLMVPLCIFGWYALVQRQPLRAPTAFAALAWIQQMRDALDNIPQVYNVVASLGPSLRRLVDFFAAAGQPPLPAAPPPPKQGMGGSNVVGTTTMRQPLLINDSGAPPPLVASSLDNGSLHAPLPSQQQHTDQDRSGHLDDYAIRLLDGTVAAPLAPPSDDTDATPSDRRPASDAVTVFERLSFAVRRGECLVLCGLSGCGKSSLLAALAKARPLLAGECHVDGSRAYVAQRPFLLNGTVRENILFGTEYDAGRYAAAIEAAVLGPDLRMLPSTDATLVGESGIQLSGGQRARVAFARALYAQADVLLLDDVFAAVDARVGRQLWRTVRALRQQGTTLVCVTHQLQLLQRPEVDRVALLHEGRVLASLHGEDETTADVKREGIVAAADFRFYASRFGTRCTLLGLGLLAVGGAVLSVAGNVFLSHWSDANGACDPVAGCDQATQRFYVLVYVGLGVCTELCFAAQLVVLTLCSLRASHTIHNEVLAAVLAAPMSFFDTHPSGHVINRLLQDLQQVDSSTPRQLLALASKLLSICTQVGLVLYFAPWVLLCLPVLLPAYAAIFAKGRPAAREARRIEAAAHTPAYTHFGDVLAGRTTIAAYGAEARFERQNVDLITAMTRGMVMVDATFKWAQTPTVQLGAALYLVCGIACVLSNGLLAHGLTASQLGLVLLYANELQRKAMELMVQLTQVEVSFVAVERLNDRGTMRLDGVDLAAAPLAHARSRIRLCAQDALLHRGTLLDNLTAFVTSSSPVLLADSPPADSPEAACWAALADVGLRERVEALPLGLATAVGAADFSEGERQLLSVCRALIADGPDGPRVFLCDEPTSNVDLARDEMVHAKLLRLRATVVVICHRLQHIFGFERVVVMHEGRVVESGAPSSLLRDKESRLAALCVQAGVTAPTSQ